MGNNREDYPQGQATFLFTDVVGSTRLWEFHPEAMHEAITRHDDLLKEAIITHQGRIVKTTGDGIHAVFASAVDAVTGAIAAQKRIQLEVWRGIDPLLVRMGLHTGESYFREGDYYGSTLNRAARIMSIGHGGQILLSDTVHALLKNHPSLPFQMLDLGVHRLKGLGKPERIYQILDPDLPAHFPALMSLGAISTNLPLQTTEFIGRKEEIESLKERLARTRLLTLIGPGGTGKTRLALQAAAELLDQYPDGVFFADLAPLNDAALFASSIAEALNVRELKTEPILETLKRSLERKSLLLVLDNFEHIVEAVPIVGQLLAAGPNVDILVTSREMLHISGEQVYPVPPLELPQTGRQLNLQQIASNEAIQLFSSRARAANPAFRITLENAEYLAEICRQLDGLPLAIELAAARTRLFTPKKLLERMSDRLRILTGGGRDRHARQQTLRAAIDWSYDLLEAPEQKLFVRLSVFSGGGSLEALEAVCADDLDMDILDGLESLLDKSLIGQEEDFEGQPRIVMLETLHAYARERHREHEDRQATLTAHAEWMLAFAESGEEGLFGQSANLWIDRLRAEEGNLRVVLERCNSGRLEPEIGVQLAGALRYYWEATGKLGEGIAWLKAMLSISTELPAALRAKALCGAGVLSYWSGDSFQGAEFCQQALDAGQEIGDMVIVGEAQHFLAHVAQNQGDPDLGVELLTASHENFLAIDHHWGVRRSRTCLADAQRLQQHYELAASNFDDAIREHRESAGDGTMMLAMYLSNYGNVLNRQGKYQQANDCFREGIQIGQALNNSMLIAYLVDGLAGNAVLSGNPEDAALLMGASEGIFEAEKITSMAAIDQFDHDYYLAEIRANLQGERLDMLWDKGKYMSVEETVKYILDRRWPMG